MTTKEKRVEVVAQPGRPGVVAHERLARHERLADLVQQQALPGKPESPESLER